MSECTACGSPAVRGFQLCGGCLLIGVANDLVDQVASGSANRVARAVVEEFGPQAVSWAKARLGRAQKQEEEERPSGLVFLQGLGFNPAGKDPTRQEVEEFRRRMARAFHGDNGKAPIAGDMMSRINEACDEVQKGL